MYSDVVGGKACNVRSSRAYVVHGSPRFLRFLWLDVARARGFHCSDFGETGEGACCGWQSEVEVSSVLQAP